MFIHCLNFPEINTLRAPPPLLQLYILSFLCVIRLHAAAARFDAVPQKAVWEFECGIPLFFFHSFFHIFYIFLAYSFLFLFAEI